MSRTRFASVLVVAVAAVLAGCEGPEGAMASNLTTTEDAQTTANGLTNNGLARNGLARNGLARNGLAAAGLASAEFKAWFDSDPTIADMVMRYTARCAVGNGSSLVWTRPSTGVTYTWPGLLGLAPGWAAGTSATTNEKQIVTACLAALVNKYGLQVPVSLQGRSAAGAKIPLAFNEARDYATPEGCFFGDIFSGDGAFAGLDHGAYSSSASSPRACAFDATLNGTSAACDPMVQFGYCWDVCVRDTTGAFYETCTLNGKSYKPITTRLNWSALYTCGDGICQSTEKCGTTGAASACWDCGPCH